MAESLRQAGLASSETPSIVTLAHPSLRRLRYAAEVPRGGRLVAQRLVRPRRVVLVHEPPDHVLELRRRFVLLVPQALRLQRPEPPLHQHAVPPPGPSVHALRHVAGFQERDVPLRAEDTALVAVHHGRRAVGLEGAPGAGDDLARLHRVREPPRDHVAAVPVDHSGEVHVPPPICT